MRYPENNHKILILGGGYAGVMAAARLARNRVRAEITLIDARPELVQRIRLHETLAGSSPRTLPYERALARRGIRFVQARVESLEPRQRKVLARAPGGERLEMEYDTLIYALGSRTAAPMPGLAERAIRLDDPAELRQAYERLQPGMRVLVVGGGLTGIEASTELAERLPGLKVTLATRGRIADGWSPAATEHFLHRFRELGIELREGASVETAEGFDLCIWAGGFEALPLAREAGLPTDAAGRIRVDDTLRVPGHPEIFAAGDAAVAAGAGGWMIRMGCVSALPMGAQVGENVARVLRGEEPEPFPFAIVIRCVSLGRTDGLVQFTAADDTPTGRVWTRRLAAVVKELICQMTYWVMKAELSLGIRLYRWSGAPAPSAPIVTAEGRR